ncbi:MAG: element excision factor XisH family protein [Chloroflexota bacterium]|nr:element excision factor XisH family protein [Chloroflexota bacterium]
MPAIDSCEPQVVRALDKIGWLLKQRQYSIRLGRRKSRYVHADLLLTHVDTLQSLIVIEVKCFTNTRTIVGDFYCAVGQYLFYRNALKWDQKMEVLYLALPTTAYARLMQLPAARTTLLEAKINLIVVDLQREEVERWITPV